MRGARAWARSRSHSLAMENLLHTAERAIDGLPAKRKARKAPAGPDSTTLAEMHVAEYSDQRSRQVAKELATAKMEDDVSKLTEANKSLSAALSNFNVGAAGSSKSPTDGKRNGGSDNGKSGKSPSSGAKRPMDLIARLQEQGDMFTRKIELEKRLAALEVRARAICCELARSRHSTHASCHLVPFSCNLTEWHDKHGRRRARATSVCWRRRWLWRRWR